jgi:hypothetical protein
LTRPIALSGLQPLATGSTRAVHVHPDDPDLLIKVMLPSIIEKRYGAGRRWYKSQRRYRHFISYLREVREEIALRAHCGGEHPKCLQKIAGFVDTDMGFGLVVEAAKSRDGQLAQALPDLIKAGRFDAKMKADLDDCLADLMRLPVVLGDLHPGNLVYAWSAQHGDHFVLIDGIGCKTLIPVNRLSQGINRYSKRRMFAKLLAGVERMAQNAQRRRQRAQTVAQAAE